MSVEQRRVFDELAASLEVVLDQADAQMVEAAAVALEQARTATAAVDPSLRVENRFGHLEPDPMIRVARDAWLAFRQYAEQLGIGPSARARLAGVGVSGRDAKLELDGVADVVELRRAK